MNPPYPLIRGAALAAVLLLAPAAANAHIVTGQKTAVVGSYTPVEFRVGHGCEGKATTAVRVEIPAGVDKASPRDMPGWRTSVETRDGRTVAITWKGRLPDDRYEAFVVFMKLPGEPGVLYLPTVQTCGKLESRWVQIPAGDGAALSHPSPKLVLEPAPTSEHDHH